MKGRDGNALLKISTFSFARINSLYVWSMNELEFAKSMDTCSGDIVNDGTPAFDRRVKMGLVTLLVAA